jgi:hypothetical protein
MGAEKCAENASAKLSMHSLFQQFKVSTSVQTETAKEKFLSKFLEHKEFSFYGAQLLPQMENGNISEPFDWNEWLNKTKNESGD